MNIRRLIIEELNDVKFNQLLQMTYALLKSAPKNDDFGREDLSKIIHKAFKNLGMDLWIDNDILDKVFACFEQSPTFNINSPDFIKNPKLKTFDVKVKTEWTGGGFDNYFGELTAYSKESLTELIKYEGLYSELEYERDFKYHEILDVIIENIEEVSSSINEDTLKGGLSDNMTLKDISKKHKVSEKELKNQLEKGIEIEMEHTNKRSEAKEIAMDHLYENPIYYDNLKSIESKDFDRPKYYEQYYKNLTPEGFKVKRKGNEIIITIPEPRKS